MRRRFTSVLRHFPQPISDFSAVSLNNEKSVILVYLNNEKSAILVYHIHPVGVELFCNAKTFFCFIKQI